MIAERFVLVNLIARLWFAAIAAGLWRALDADQRGWLYAAVLIASLALDLAGAYLGRRLDEEPQAWIAADTLVSKAIYVVLFVALAAEQRLPAWLALPMVARDLALVLGAVWVWARTGRFPAPTGHERWPTQLFILVLAIYVAGVLWIGPALLLLFGLLLTRLPGFWLRWCLLLDPEAYQPVAGDEGGKSPPLQAMLSRSASWLTVAALPVGMLATAMVGVWLATGDVAEGARLWLGVKDGADVGWGGFVAVASGGGAVGDTPGVSGPVGAQAARNVLARVMLPITEAISFKALRRGIRPSW